VKRWVEVGKSADFRPGEGRTVVAGDLRLALFNDNGQLFAIDDTCPHQGASLGEGLLHEGRVICPLHSWVFELRTGQCPRATHESVRTYATRCGEGSVEVQIPIRERGAE
jgi:NAD(P)H-dependent nitrite reductase small subunit